MESNNKKELLFLKQVLVNYKLYDEKRREEMIAKMDEEVNNQFSTITVGKPKQKVLTKIYK